MDLNTCNKVHKETHIFLGNSFPKIGLQKDIYFFSFFYNIIISHVQNYSYAIIWLLSLILLVGLSSCGTVMPVSYITSPLLSSLSHLLCSFPLLYVYADDMSKHSSLPPQLPLLLSRVTSLPFLLCKHTKVGLRALKIQVCLGWSTS